MNNPQRFQNVELAVAGMPDGHSHGGHMGSVPRRTRSSLRDPPWENTDRANVTRRMPSTGRTAAPLGPGLRAGARIGVGELAGPRLYSAASQARRDGLDALVALTGSAARVRDAGATRRRVARPCSRPRPTCRALTGCCRRRSPTLTSAAPSSPRPSTATGSCATRVDRCGSAGPPPGPCGTGSAGPPSPSATPRPGGAADHRPAPGRHRRPAVGPPHRCGRRPRPGCRSPGL